MSTKFHGEVSDAPDLTEEEFLEFVAGDERSATEWLDAWRAGGGGSMHPSPSHCFVAGRASLRAEIRRRDTDTMTDETESAEVLSESAKAMARDLYPEDARMCVPGSSVDKANKLQRAKQDTWLSGFAACRATHRHGEKGT